MLDLANRQYKIGRQPFSTMVSTVHPENVGSEKILRDKLGIMLEEQAPKFSKIRKIRNIYSKKII